jgi:Domain of unknown function (DUF4878)
MRIYTVILTAFAALAMTACSTTPPANQTPSNAANAVNQTNQQTARETKPAESALSPTETLRAFDEASRKKDTAAIKSYISQGTLDLLNKRAEKEKRSVDELLKQGEALPPGEVPEMRNEKIEGDKATVELQNTFTGEYEVIPLVKEDGVWKVALDVLAKEYEKEMSEEMNEPPDNSSEKPKANKP